MAGKRITAIDRIVAEKIRTHRKALGFSQTEIADKLGVTFQQVQKYEMGTNRIGAGRLFELADIFNVPIDALFPKSGTSSKLDDDQNREVFRLSQFATSADGWRLCRAFLKIDDAKVRKALIALTEQVTSKYAD